MSINDAKAQPLCEICQKAERKYKCPRCGLSTCSLTCCRQHKTQFQCSGQRERIQFVSTGEFTEKQLRQDYHFLEDVLQTKVGAKRSFANLYDENEKTKFTNPGALNSMSAQQSLTGYPKHVKTLVNEASKRTTKVLLQPMGMSRRKENTSHFSSQKKSIFWKIAIVFIMKDDFKVTDILNASATAMNQMQAIHAPAICLHVNSVNELETIANIRSKALNSIQSGSILRQVMRTMTTTQQTLHCLLRVIPSPANKPLFREIELSSNVKEALTGMTVIEYPTLYFCHDAVRDKLRLLVHDAVIQEEQDEIPLMVNVEAGEQIEVESQSKRTEEMQDSEMVDKKVYFPEVPQNEDAMSISPKKRTYGGLLMVDYSSSEECEEEGEEGEIVEAKSSSQPSPPSVPSAVGKYQNFFSQLASQQQAAQADTVTTGEKNKLMLDSEEDEDEDEGEVGEAEEYSSEDSDHEDNSNSEDSEVSDKESIGD